ncbi:MAG: hypothetical protein WCP43_06215, partial [Dehalococcoidia bacterium]
LGGAATVDGILTLTSGNLVVTDPYVLTMGASATTTGAKDVTGIIKRTTLVANTSYTFGNQFTMVAFQNVGTLPSEVSIKVTLSVPSWKTGAVQRTYDIIRTGGSSDSLVTVYLHYLDSELNGNTAANLVFYDYHVVAARTDEHGRSSIDTTNKWVGLSNLHTTYLTTGWGERFWALANSTTVSNTWLGAASTDWTAIANWTSGRVPLSTDNVTIPDAATTANDPTLPADTTIHTLTLQTGAVLNSAAGSTLTIAGGSGAWNNNGGTFNPSTGTVIFTNAAATISGITNFYNVTINSGAVLWLNFETTMRIAGTMTNNGTWRTVIGGPTTVEYNGGDQTVVVPNPATNRYSTLILSGSGIKTMPTTVLSIEGIFSMSGTATATAGAAINTTGSFTVGAGTSFTTGAYAHTIGGDFSNSGTFTATGSTVTLNGT